MINIDELWGQISWTFISLPRKEENRDKDYGGDLQNNFIRPELVDFYQIYTYLMIDRWWWVRIKNAFLEKSLHPTWSRSYSYKSHTNINIIVIKTFYSHFDNSVPFIPLKIK